MNVVGLGRPLRGIVPPMVTPLAGPDALDREGLARLIDRILAGGVQGLFILGTTGDGPALSYRLRQEVIQETCDLVAGRVPVLVGITDTSYTESMAIAQFAARAGAQAAVLAPPYYFHVSQRDLLRLAESVVRDCPLPLFLYNMPNLTKMQWEPETVAAASEMSQVVGLKDSSGDVAYLGRVLAAVADKPHFTVLVGPEHLLLDSLRAGAHGGVCGGANLMPQLFVRLFDAFHRGNQEEASLLQKRIVEIGSPLYAMGEIESSYIRGLKGALAEAGVCSAQLPWPFAEADLQERASIRAHLLRFPEISLKAGSSLPRPSSEHGISL